MAKNVKRKLKVNSDGTVTYRMKAGKDTVVATMLHSKAVLLQNDKRFRFEYADSVPSEDAVEADAADSDSEVTE